MRRPTIESPRAFALVAAATLLAALPAAAAAQQLASNVPDSLEVATLAPTPIAPRARPTRRGAVTRTAGSRAR